MKATWPRCECQGKTLRNWRDVPLVGVPPLDQNKKYRCAIGSTVAGSQVSSSPS